MPAMSEDELGRERPAADFPRHNASLPEKRREVRSFVLRAGRMSPGQRRAYERYRDRYCVPYLERPLDLSELFPGFRDVTVEVGFGMGRATAEIAASNPETAYLGIEVHTPGVGKLLSLIVERGLRNVRIIEHDAVAVFTHMIPEESLAGIHIFFPDPWPKKRHHKRRLVNQVNIGLFLRALRPGGYIHLATDWQEYADRILETLSNTDGIENTACGFAPRPAWRPVTAFERKGSEQGRPVHEIIFRKT
jgi:tRNA (guanine-N7-)-methyltransferase